jgi:hypothetical protein
MASAQRDDVLANSQPGRRGVCRSGPVLLHIHKIKLRYYLQRYRGGNFVSVWRMIVSKRLALSHVESTGNHLRTSLGTAQQEALRPFGERIGSKTCWRYVRTVSSCPAFT